MYSVVLLMALSGSQAPALGHHDGCSGCTGNASCSGCCGGYVVTGTGCSGCCGGCSGWATSSCTGCSGCTGCTGDCHGGGRHHFFGKHRLGHGSCHGCCGGCSGTVISYDTCGGCSGCCGGTAVVPAAPPVMEAPKKEPAPLPKEKQGEVRSPAAPADGATFVTEPVPAFEAPPSAASTEARSFGSRILGRLRGPSAP
jgi:hypothetical protein